MIESMDRSELISGIERDIQNSIEVIHTDDKLLIEAIEDKVLSYTSGREISLHEKGALIDRIYANAKGYGILQRFLEDEAVTEIMINGTDTILIEKNSTFIDTNARFESKEHLNNTIQKIASSTNKTVNRMKPILDLSIGDGSRVNIVLDPISINGPTVTIRKFSKRMITLDDMLAFGNFTAEACRFLKDMVSARKNLFISGGTGSGKTTLLNALIEQISDGERLVIIEDSPEIRTSRLSNVVRLEPRIDIYDSGSEITVSDLIRTSLRMRPDRIIVGEVRGEETLYMLQALNTGHNGSMSTGHANSNVDMLYRIETMIMMSNSMNVGSIKRQIVSGIDFLISVSKCDDGLRRITSIQEMCGLSDEGYVLRDCFRLKGGDGSAYELLDCRNEKVEEVI